MTDSVDNLTAPVTLDGTSYRELAMRTAAGPEVFHYPKDEEEQYYLSEEFLSDLLTFLKASFVLDNWKSRLFYNKTKYKDYFEISSKMDIFKNEIRDSGKVSLSNIKNPQLIHGILGIASESGEIVQDFIKMMLGSDHPEYQAAQENMFRELGDIDWFQELTGQAINKTCSEWRENNINRLRKRFPGKFSETDALNRADEKE